MCKILLADLLLPFILREVVIAIGKCKASLADAGNLLGRVELILLYIEAKKIRS